MPSRRTFLASAGASCAFAAMPRMLRAQSTSPFQPAYLEPYLQHELTLTRFQSLVGSSFRTQLSDGTRATLELISVLVLYAPAGKVGPALANTGPIASAAQPGNTVHVAPVASKPQPLTDSFRLRFTSGSAQLEQKTYVLDHASLGSFAVFLVPGKMQTGDLCASATFILGAHSAVSPAASKVAVPITSQAPVGLYAR